MEVRRAPAVQSPPVGGKGSADRHHLARGVMAGFAVAVLTGIESVAMSAIGPKLTFLGLARMSASRGKADTIRIGHHFCF
jgi:hypothetical protein